MRKRRRRINVIVVPYPIWKFWEWMEESEPEIYKAGKKIKPSKLRRMPPKKYPAIIATIIGLWVRSVFRSVRSFPLWLILLCKYRGRVLTTLRSKCYRVVSRTSSNSRKTTQCQSQSSGGTQDIQESADAP